MLKIVVTGPESSGKTTLARQLASHFRTIWVPEFARTYIDGLGRPYREADLLEIAEGQIALEDEMAAKADSLLFFDTSLEVIKIWAEFRYGRCHPRVLEQLEKRRHDLYLLCAPDLPWAFDPQRENPDDRHLLFRLYQGVLTGLQVNFQEISGTGETRMARAISAVSEVLPATKP
jgi:NadR type nicotinamide-nucleotide adenylyltransferase